MAIKKSFNGQTILKPGAYSRMNTANTAGSSTVSTDVVFLIGESSKGIPGSISGIIEYGAANLDQMIEYLGDGPLVDAALAARSPSNTPGISGVGRYLVYKTNSTTQASATVDGIEVKDSAWGAGGNLKTIQVQLGSTANQRILKVVDELGRTETLGETQAQTMLTIEYTGDATTADLVISGTTRSALTLDVTLAGDQTDGSANLSIPLAGKTMQQLVDSINAATGYTATIGGASQSVRPATDLDALTSTSILTALPLRRLKLETIDLLNSSSNIQAEETSMTPAVLTVGTITMTGGSQGASTNADFADGMAKSLAETYNIMVPCISKSAADDILDGGFTDPASTYTFTSVMSAMSNHLALRGNTKNRKEAQGMAGMSGTKAQVFEMAQTLSDYNIQLFCEDMVFVNAKGTNQVGQPYILAAACAGIRAGTSVGEPLTHKFVRTLAIGHKLDPITLLPTGDFNSGTDADDAILAGVTFCEKANGGFRIVVDNTTYGIDESFIYNRGSVIEAAYYVNKTLRETAETIFVGKKVSNGMAGSIKNIIRNKLRELNAPEVQIITSSDGAPEGFREDTFVVTVTGNTARIQLEYCPVQSLEFLFFDFTIGDIIQSA